MEVAMKLNIRQKLTLVEHKFEEAGLRAERPLQRVAVIAVVQNPFADQYVEDLSPLINASIALGNEMAAQGMEAMKGTDVQAYGKGGIAGVRCEQEHANALLTTAFADPFRAAIGGGKAWISSVTKVGGPGTTIDVPLNHKDEVYVRSHYDAMSIVLSCSPLPDEIAIIFCLSSGGRLNARVGGLTHEDVLARCGPT